MVFIKFLGIIDVLIAVIFFVGTFFQIAIFTSFTLFLALILLTKGLLFLFSYDLASGIDVIIAFIIIYATQFTIASFIVVIIPLFLLQKGIVSMVS